MSSSHHGVPIDIDYRISSYYPFVQPSSYNRGQCSQPPKKHYFMLKLRTTRPGSKDQRDEEESDALPLHNSSHKNRRNRVYGCLFITQWKSEQSPGGGEERPRRKEARRPKVIVAPQSYPRSAETSPVCVLWVSSPAAATQALMRGSSIEERISVLVLLASIRADVRG